MRNCLIMGCGRSGTSLLAGLFASSGYYQGDDLFSPNKDNPRGFFEDRRINSLNERLMRSVVPFTSRWFINRLFPKIPLWSNGWMCLFPLDAEVEATDEQQDEISSILERSPFCLKDPRFSFTYPAWKPFLPKATMIAVFREPVEVCASIAAFFERRRVKYSPGFIFSVWLRVYEHILSYRKEGGRWLFVDYKDLLNGEALPRLEAALNAAPDPGMIDPSLYRSRSSTIHRKAPEECAQMYSRLRRIAQRDQS